MNSICVYLGASSGNQSVFQQAVISLGEEIARLKLTLIYGGSNCGLMGLLARTVKTHQGKVIGISTNQLVQIEKPLDTLDELTITDSMQERKKTMLQRADMFLVMPGGLGTLEEAFETWNAIKIGLLHKPLGFLNIDGYFDELLAFINTSREAGFLTEHDQNIPKVNSDVVKLVAALRNK